jgi:hypothetical protein
MHMSSLKYANSAYFRSVASTIAVDLEERLWLRMADVDNVTDCADVTDTGTAYTELVNDWKNRSKLTPDAWHGFDARLAQIRNLDIELPETPPGPAESISAGLEGKFVYIEIPITLSWAESRFDFTEEQDLPYDESDLSEEYPYTIRVFCRGASTAPAPTTTTTESP